MKVTVLILQMLLMAVLSYVQDKCKKEKQQIQYYLYKANVEIKTYPCLLNNNHTCKEYGYKELVNYYPDHIANQCLLYHYPKDNFVRITSGIYKHNKIGPIFVTLCETPAFSNLLKDTVTILPNKLRLYNPGRYYNPNYNHYILWSTNICQDLRFMYTGFFDVWIDRLGNKYIRTEQISLKLMDEKSFCDAQIWKTDYDGIIVSTSYWVTGVNETLPWKLKSPLPYDCDITEKSEDIRTNTDWKISIPSASSGLYSQTGDGTSESYPQSDLQMSEKLNSEEEVKKLEVEYVRNMEDIETLKSLGQCIMFVLVLFALWYVFSVIINFSTLWTIGKWRKSGRYAHLMNCVSHSLTSHYLSFVKSSGEESELTTLESLPKLHETVENEFYNKPF